MSYIAAQILFLTSLFGLLGACNAVRRLRPDRNPWLRPWWFPALLTAELVPAHMVVHTLVATLCVSASALDQPIGTWGLWLTGATYLLYVPILVRAAAARTAMRAALAEVGFDADTDGSIPWWKVLVGWPYRLPNGIARAEDIEFAPGLVLDVYGPFDRPHPLPAIIQVHGGGWRGGNRRQQARPLMHHLAARGWVCVAISYPLVPDATFPDQLVGVKRAVAWIRDHAGEHGIDPQFIAITGGSAGGHLAALAALTPNRPEYQPGFEDADTSIQAAVPFYGIYDFLNRNGTRDEWPVIPELVMRAAKADRPELFRAASPLDQVNRDAPPFLVVHGDTDSVVPPREAAQFVDALEAVSRAPVSFALVPGANHAFDVLESLRTQHVVRGVAAFLSQVREAATAVDSGFRY